MPDTGSGATPPDLATMLAEMDSRLLALQQELESVSLPIARRTQEPRRAGARSGVELAAPPARHDDAEEDAVEEDAREPAPERPARESRVAARPATRAARATERTERPPRPGAATPTEAPEQAAAPRTPRLAPRAARADPATPAADDVAPAAEPPVGQRKRTRRITAISRGRPAAGAAQGTPREPEASAEPAAPATIVRQTILDAEEEARRVIDDARHRIADIGARTRALLEHSVASPASAAPAAPPASAAPPAPAAAMRGRRSRSVEPAERREYEGTVTVEAGPFSDVVELSEFEHALASVPGVEDVFILTFERHHAHFEVHLTEPTQLVAELQSRAPEALHVVEAAEDHIRLEIFKDDLG